MFNSHFDITRGYRLRNRSTARFLSAVELVVGGAWGDLEEAMAAIGLPRFFIAGWLRSNGKSYGKNGFIGNLH